MDEEQLRHDQIGGQITALKERFGIASAQAESLQGQLQQAQRKCATKRTRAAKNAGKIDRTFTRINGAQNHPFEKEKHFAEQQQHIEQSKQQLA